MTVELAPVRIFGRYSGAPVDLEVGVHVPAFWMQVRRVGTSPNTSQEFDPYSGAPPLYVYAGLGI